MQAQSNQDQGKNVPVDGVNPATGLDLSAKGLEGELGTEGIVGDVLLSISVLDEGGDDADVGVRAGGRNQDVVRMPGDVQNGRVVKLDVLRDPPVVILIEVADGDDLGAGGDGELVLTRRPGTASGGTVDTQQHQGGVPGVVLETPDVGVTILRARQDAVVLVAPGERSNNGVVLVQGVDQSKLARSILVDLDSGIVGAQRDQGAISVPGVSSDGDSQALVSHGCKIGSEETDFGSPKGLLRLKHTDTRFLFSLASSPLQNDRNVIDHHT